jgi:hypothetical protein
VVQAPSVPTLVAIGNTHLAPHEQPAPALVLGRLRAEQLRVGGEVTLQDAFGVIGLLDHLDQLTVAQDKDRAHGVILRRPPNRAAADGPTRDTECACAFETGAFQQRGSQGRAAESPFTRR